MAGKAVTVKFLGDASDFERAANRVQKAGDATGSKLSKIVNPTTIAAAGVAVAGFAGTSIKAFRESEESAAKLELALAKFPRTADTSIERLGKLNEQLARKTKFDDDATASGQAVLASFNLTGKQIEQLTPLLQDYASRTGKDLPTAAQDLGKAMLGQGKALKAIGIDFQDTGSEAGNFDQVIGGLRDKVGGFAEKEGQTTSGRLEILKNQFGEVQEKVGEKLVPALTKLADILLTVIGFVGNMHPGLQILLGVLAGLAVAVWLIVKAKQAWVVVQAALNIVMMLNPIGLVVLAIVALVAILVVAWKHSETFRDTVKGAFNAVWDAAKAIGGGISDAFSAAFNGIKAVAIGAINFVTQNVLNPLIEGINTVIRGFNALPGVPDLPTIGKIAKIAAGVEKGGPGGSSSGGVRYMAHGGMGTVTSPTLFVAGEAGAEDFAFAPRSKGGFAAMGGSQTINLVVDGRVLASVVVDDINRRATPGSRIIKAAAVG